MFYNKQAWVGMYFDRGGGLGGAGLEGQRRQGKEGGGQEVARSNNYGRFLGAVDELPGDGSEGLL